MAAAAKFQLSGRVPARGVFDEPAHSHVPSFCCFDMPRTGAVAGFTTNPELAWQDGLSTIEANRPGGVALEAAIDTRLRVSGLVEEAGSFR